jgi:NAD(P)-dependent dehydrogenase (short-subunit alcohol dehydrogenase family)
MHILRENLLAGRSVALAGGVSPVIGDALTGLGARLERFDDALDEDSGQEWARARAPVHALVYAAAPAFGRGGASGLAGSLERAWVAVRAVATGAMIDREDHARIVLLAPGPAAGEHAAATRSALENLARTLAVEWARFGITATAIAPGSATSDDEVAALVGFLLSAAGGYFSGCRFDMGAVPAR